MLGAGSGSRPWCEPGSDYRGRRSGQPSREARPLLPVALALLLCELAFDGVVGGEALPSRGCRSLPFRHLPNDCALRPREGPGSGLALSPKGGLEGLAPLPGQRIWRRRGWRPDPVGRGAGRVEHYRPRVRVPGDCRTFHTSPLVASSGAVMAPWRNPWGPTSAMPQRRARTVAARRMSWPVSRPMTFWTDLA